MSNLSEPKPFHAATSVDMFAEMSLQLNLPTIIASYL